MSRAQVYSNGIASVREDIQNPPEPIAIIGMGCRFPGGVNNPQSFWQLLTAEIDAIGEIPSGRFDVNSYYDPRPATPGKMNTRWGGFLQHIEEFDALFFGISPREAERMDPQQRLLLEVGYEALEDAGVVPSRLGGSRTGVFVGQWLGDYEARLSADPNFDFYMTTGTGRYSTSGRLSYVFGLQGPSITVDTACSSSLVAVHLACQSLVAGESSIALAGAANIILEPHITIAYSQSGMMAPDGRCKFGDARADGYVRSEGVALIVLKRLSDALADGDRIHAVILGSAVNNDGRTGEFMTTPAIQGQKELLRQAYAAAGVSPGEVQYVEAHGTGTRAGDPVEIEAIAAVLSQGRDQNSPCAIGSVKTNIGHTESAAGLAGLIKVILSFQHGTIPPSLHLRVPNPEIDWDHMPVKILRRASAWHQDRGPATAGVSAFGITGTNAHVVLRQTDESTRSSPSIASPRGYHLLPISATTPDALKAFAASYREYLSDPDQELNPEHICYTASVRREHYPFRLALAAPSTREMVAQLQAFLQGESPAGLAAGQAREHPKVVFVFPGQGSQWPGMGQQLYQTEPVFREMLEHCDHAIHQQTGWSLFKVLESSSETALDEIDIVQPTLFAIQVALAALWCSWGIEPDAVVGHSMGEVAAAFSAGVVSLEEAVQIICSRSRLMRSVSGRGAMAVISLTEQETEQALAGYEDAVTIAVVNGSQSTVISGDSDTVTQLMAGFKARGVFCQPIKVDVAAHSPHMEPLVNPLETELAALHSHSGSIPLYSTVTGEMIEGTMLDAEYWGRNLRQPVLFYKTTQRLKSDGYTIFLEVSPHPILLPAIDTETADAAPDLVLVPSLRRGQDERAEMLTSLAHLYVGGCAVSWSKLYPGGGRVVTLPAYPWQREYFWLEPSPPASLREKIESAGPEPATLSKSRSEEHVCNPDTLLYKIQWQRDPLAPQLQEQSARGNWLVFGDDIGVGHALATRLEALGGTCVVVTRGEHYRCTGPGRYEVNPRKAGDMALLLKDILAEHEMVCRGAAYLWNLDSCGMYSETAESTTARQTEDYYSAVLVVQALARMNWRHGSPRLWLVTAGTQWVDRNSTEVCVSHAPLWGLGATVAHEMPELFCTRVDLTAGDPLQDIGELVNELTVAPEQEQIALRGGERYTPRLVQLALPHATPVHPVRQVRPALPQESFALLTQYDGVIENLFFCAVPRVKPGRGQVEIEVRATGLNFMNVLSALGVCPGYPGGVGPLGIECAGIITAVGDEVNTLTVGQEVLAIAPNCLASYAIADAQLVVPKAAQLDWEQAAGIPIAFVTAYYALFHLAHLQAGERVLIHAATGGVGLAAIQLAQSAGAEIFATAGSAEKRDLLCRMGIKHVMDSRSLDFAQQIITATAGRGADVVLNSLAGEAIVKGLAVLAPYGRFLELGKRDIYGDSTIGLAPFRKNLSYMAIDIDRMFRERPKLVGTMLNRVMALLENGTLKPLPSHVFPVTEPVEAFRILARAGHTGKVVISLETPELPLVVADKEDGLVKQNATYLITGGTGGLGLKVAEWMVEQGARNLVLMSRSGRQELPGKTIETLEYLSQASRIVVVEGNVADKARLAEIFAEIERDMPPLRGIVHAAGILEDAVLLEMDEASFRRVLSPKVAGAWNLHHLSQDAELDFFVLFSSIASVVGSPGQGNYAAANAFLDSLANYRSAQGLAAMSINWGPWSEAGLAAQRAQGGLEGLGGIEIISPREGIEIFDRLMHSPQVQAAVMRLDIERWCRAHPVDQRSGLFAELRAAQEKTLRDKTDQPARANGSGIRETLLGLDPGRRRRAALETFVQDQVAHILKLAASRVDLNKPLRSMGLDSLMTIELKNRLQAELALQLPATLVWNYPTVTEIAAYLAERMELPLENHPAVPAQAAPVEGVPAPVDALDHAELERLLSGEMDEIDRLLKG